MATRKLPAAPDTPAQVAAAPAAVPAKGPTPAEMPKPKPQARPKPPAQPKPVPPRKVVKTVKTVETAETARVPAAAATAAKTAAKTAAAKPPRAKEKLVRDSFTMPRADFVLIQQLKDRALGFQRATRKSELLRAGLQALADLGDAQLQARLGKLATLKAGRPKKTD